jgi:hypothetical protein
MEAVTYRRFPRPGAMCSATAMARHPSDPTRSTHQSRQKSLNRLGAKAVFAVLVINQSMAELCLDCPSVVPVLGECVGASVAEHVRVRLHFKARGTRRPFDHPGEARRRERAPRSPAGAGAGPGVRHRAMDGCWACRS